MNKHLIAAIALLMTVLITDCDEAGPVNKYRIQKGDFQASLTESGELQAVVARHIVMPFLGFRYGYRQKIIGLVEHGIEVSEGDSVVGLDPSGVQKFLLERENKLEMEKAAYNKLMVQHRNTEKQLQSQLLQQEAGYSMEKLELEKSQFDSERNKKIQELEFLKAEINLDKTRMKMRYNRKIAELDRIIQATKVKQLENDTADSHNALRKLCLRSPNDGILQVDYNRYTRQLYKTGDEAYPNRSLASIPDLRRMKVKSSVNEVDIDKISPGQRVVVRLDAFPDLEFGGEISTIGKTSHKKNRDSNIKVFDIEVMVEENDSEVLKPGMTVSCEIIYAEFRDVLFVDNECIIRENGEYYIHIDRRGRVDRTAVEVGPKNNSHTVIYGDFSEGQVIIPRQELANIASR
jgi:multidrug efflux pump subunit AcrA (membrane-fusion protein)